MPNLKSNRFSRLPFSEKRGWISIENIQHTFLEIINYIIDSYFRQEEVFLNDGSVQTCFPVKLS